MNQNKIAWVVGLGLALAVSGCNKKTADQANLSSTGFENVSSQAELAQLPQANSSTTQQGAIEVLPIETSPVTQSIPAAPVFAGNNSASLANSTVTTTVSSTSSKEAASSTGSISHNKKIQTALKNAGLYNGPIDGKIGPGSRRAIETFQSNNGLKVDGKVGPKTWRVLEPFLSGAPVATAMASSQVVSSDATVAQEGN